MITYTIALKLQRRAGGLHSFLLCGYINFKMSTTSATSQPALSDEGHISFTTSPNTMPHTPDDISRWQCHIDLQNFGKGLQEAARAAFPNVSKSRYTNVSVLLLSWENEDPRLPVSIEIEELDEVFRNIYGFKTEIWKIQDQNCHGKVNQKILDFAVMIEDPRDHLFIVYYAGHSQLTKDRRLSWTRFVVRFLSLTLDSGFECLRPFTKSDLYCTVVGRTTTAVNVQWYSGVIFRAH